MLIPRIEVNHFSEPLGSFMKKDTNNAEPHLACAADPDNVLTFRLTLMKALTSHHALQQCEQVHGKRCASAVLHGVIKQISI